tara:strand:+ start:633 stop:905 length:273 start_codon:yes stop_codon:yes gene_type:complete
MIDQDKLYQKFKEQLSSLDDEQFIESFNEQVGNYGWGVGRSIYLGIIREEFKERGIDISEIQSENGGISYRNKVKLENKKVSLIENKFEE